MIRVRSSGRVLHARADEATIDSHQIDSASDYESPASAVHRVLLDDVCEFDRAIVTDHDRGVVAVGVGTLSTPDGQDLLPSGDR